MEIIEKTPSKEFQAALKGFIGSEQYYRHRLPNGMQLLLTDGCNYIREKGEAYWLFDLILSWQLKLRKHRFQVWKLERQNDESWFIECCDGNKLFIVGQEVNDIDFPLNNLELWVIDGVALLPTEY